MFAEGDSTNEQLVQSALRSIRPDLSPELVKTLVADAIKISPEVDSHQHIVCCAKVRIIKGLILRLIV